jgi:hypothetical protein
VYLGFELSGKPSYGAAVVDAARILRAKGSSLSDIAKVLNVAKSTVSGWVRDISVPELQRNLLSRRSHNQSKARAALAQMVDDRRGRWRSEASAIWQSRSDRLFSIGIGLYWGEGTKVGCLELVNSDARIVRLWIKWCRSVLPSVEFRVKVQAHLDRDLGLVRDFWASVVGTEFITVRAVKSRSVASVRKLPHGTAAVSMKRGAAEWLFKMLCFFELSGYL